MNGLITTCAYCGGKVHQTFEDLARCQASAVSATRHSVSARSCEKQDTIITLEQVGALS